MASGDPTLAALFNCLLTSGAAEHTSDGAAEHDSMAENGSVPAGALQLLLPHPSDQLLLPPPSDDHAAQAIRKHKCGGNRAFKERAEKPRFAAKMQPGVEMARQRGI